MASVDAVPSVVPTRRRRPSVEVIDVDSLDDDIVFAGFGRSQRRRLSQTPATGGSSRHSALSSGTIVIVDSDDEEPQTSAAGRRHRFVSPAPPPARRGPVPPVPPLPRHLAGLASFPTHHGRAPVAGVIQPIHEPFPFEVNINPPAPRASPPPLAYAPRSHHQPVMGLGGALIAMNRQHAAEDAQQNAPRHGGAFFNSIANATGYLVDAFSRFIGDNEEHPARPEHRTRRLDFFASGMDDLLHRHNFPAYEHRDYRVFEQRKPEYWRPSFTHPRKALSGFSFDFDTTSSAPPQSIITLDDVGGPSGSSSSRSSSSKSPPVDITMTLICARCSDPLVLSVNNLGVPLSELESKKRRVWALRCGHMLDGKCVQEIMRPVSSKPPPSEAPTADDVKGKWKAIDSANDHMVPEAAEPMLSAKAKGKGRMTNAPAPDVEGKGKALMSSGENSFGTLPRADHGRPMDTGDNTIRSRLRSRRPRTLDVPVGSSSSGSHVADSSDSSRRVRSLPRRRGGASRAKGKGMARAVLAIPQIEADHEWLCPVPGCGHNHRSICIGGEWKMDEQRGAVAMFV